MVEEDKETAELLIPVANISVSVPVAASASAATEAETEQPSEKVSSPQPTADPVSVPDAVPSPTFDPSKMVGIIRRKALIKDLAAAYHAECLDYCQQLLPLQRKWEQNYADLKPSEELRKESVRPPKRAKKLR